MQDNKQEIAEFGSPVNRGKMYQMYRVILKKVNDMSFFRLGGRRKVFTVRLFPFRQVISFYILVFVLSIWKHN